jgi:opacity protein-like surface antigen
MRMTTTARLAALLAVCGAFAASPVSAADLGTYGGSVKDEYIPAAPASAVGNCYFRADVGYSGSADPEVTWPVTDATTGDFITDHVRNIGCGSGSRGFRGEVTLGYHGDRKYDGEPYPWVPGPCGIACPPPVDDPMHTSITTYTLMVNGYKDLGNFRGFTPYIGAGVGIAYNIVDDVYFTDNPALVNQIHGDRDIAFAWSLMAGVGYQFSARSVVDVGYRYIDMGKATSERHDTAGFVNPRVNIDDLEAHELKVGLRYHFGQADCCAYPAIK